MNISRNDCIFVFKVTFFHIFFHHFTRVHLLPGMLCSAEFPGSATAHTVEEPTGQGNFFVGTMSFCDANENNISNKYIQIVATSLRSCWEYAYMYIHSVLCADSTFACVVVGSCCGFTVKHDKSDKYVCFPEGSQIGSVSSRVQTKNNFVEIHLNTRGCQVYVVGLVERQSPVFWRTIVDLVVTHRHQPRSLVICDVFVDWGNLPFYDRPRAASQD